MDVAHLLEWLEEPCELLVAHRLAGVLHLEAQAHGRREAHLERDYAVLGELHRVVQEIQQHLAQSALVGPDRFG